MELRVCLDNDNSDQLSQGEKYYLFEAGPQHVYVSRFPKEGSYFGVYEANRFGELPKDTEPPEWDSSHLDRSKIYKAELFYSRRYVMELTVYYVKPRKTHANFYKDPACTVFLGCFPLSWFRNFIECEDMQPETSENGHSDEITPGEYQSQAQDIQNEISLFERPDGQLSFF